MTLKGKWWESEAECLRADLHQANRRAAAFENRCAQLLEENETLRGALERIARGHTQATSSRGADELRLVAHEALDR